MAGLAQQLSSTRPLVCNIIQKPETAEAHLKFANYETYGVLPYIIGVVSLNNLEIISGTASLFKLLDKPVVETDIKVSTSNVVDDTWLESITNFVEHLGLLLFSNKRHEASKELLERINADIVEKQKKSLRDVLVEISITQHSDTEIGMNIEGDNTPYMLYMICQALELLHISVRKINISTIQDHIYDRFVLDISNSPALKHEIQQEIRVVILLTIQLVSRLGNLPSPREALLRFSALIKNLVDQRRILDLIRLSNNSRLQAEVSYVLGASEFIWQEFIQSNSLEFLRMVEQIDNAEQYIQIEKLTARLDHLLAKCDSFDEKIKCINEFKDKQSFSIDIDSLINKKDFRVFSNELSELARLIIRKTTELIYESLLEQYGTPMSDMRMLAPYALLGLGKFGGSAMGYASDLEIMLVYEGAGNTDGDVSISNGDFYGKMMQMLKHSIHSTGSGIFKIDDRMRPYGVDGPRAVSLNAFIDYYGKRNDNSVNTTAHSSEKLALTRMRPVCGDPSFVEKVLKIKDSLLYSAYSIKVAEVIKLRERQLSTKTKPGERNAKFSRGALADLEYTIQILQVLYGQKYPALRQPSLHFTIDYLSQLGEIGQAESEKIKAAYKFFRVLINALRMRRGNAEDLSLPAQDSWELSHLAKRIDLGKTPMSAEQLLVHFDATCGFIRSFSRSLLKGLVGEDMTPVMGGNYNRSVADLVYSDDFKDFEALLSFCKNPRASFESIKSCGHASLVPRLSEVLLLLWGELERSGVADEILINLKRMTNALSTDKQHQLYQEFITQPAKLFVLVRIFAGSRYLSDKIISNPSELDLMTLASTIHKTKNLGAYKNDFKNFVDSSIERDSAVARDPSIERDPAVARDPSVSSVAPVVREPSALERDSQLPSDPFQQIQYFIRQYKNKETLRIITRDLCLGIKFEKIVSEISNLAQALLEYAFAQSCALHPQLPNEGITVLAMGKFGAKELNYSSDIDLVCVFEDKHKTREPQVVKLIQVFIKTLGEYIYGGTAYRIDLRLRPFGVGSNIVSSVSSIQDYYNRDARLWELQALIKCRPVAGDLALGERVVKNLQEYLIMRAGQAEYKEEWKKNVASLRVRADNQDLYEVKNSRGGIRDIEFGVQLLQIIQSKTPFDASTLKALSSLNTHGVIDDPTTQVLKDHYVFLRRIEHFLQVYEDRQLHQIPSRRAEFLQKLAWYLIGESDADVFVQKLQQVKNEVHTWFKSLL